MNSTYFALLHAVDALDRRDYKGASRTTPPRRARSRMQDKFFPQHAMSLSLSEARNTLGIPVVPSHWAGVSTFVEIVTSQRLAALPARSRNGHAAELASCAAWLTEARRRFRLTEPVTGEAAEKLQRMLQILRECAESAPVPDGAGATVGEMASDRRASVGAVMNVA